MAATSFDADTLRWLVCPACHGALELAAEGGGIRCVECFRQYSIVDGLAVLLSGGENTDPLTG
ncbi:MAG: Trm112 family protein [Granulicella sp.]